MTQFCTPATLKESRRSTISKFDMTFQIRTIIFWLHLRWLLQRLWIRVEQSVEKVRPARME
jgi:hypothetical protein